MKLEQHSYPSYMANVLLLTFFLGAIGTIVYAGSAELRADWGVTLAVNETFQTGEAIDFQLFVEDGQEQLIEGASVEAVFDRPETVHQIEKTFHHLGDGLYETEVIFSVPGTWVVMVEVKKGRDFYRNQYLLEVEGPIIGEQNRDPGDHFSLEQPLPEELKQLLELPVFK
ncbi:FixH family protein [Alkalihalobacillus oceani]|uniref:FixH family protein n=1 Tax=Halalkalibacter oceani TaxID=1653776 RepID=A0A9X2DMA6_9BACI|nr:FixH family protein [Halalkalibacter oceani]